jgi:mono/diheme cytochrome c family protein
MSARLLILAGALALATPARADNAGPPLSKGWTFGEQGGEALYANSCAACHQSDGEGAIGAGAYPALARDEKLAASSYVLQVVLKGMRGMPPVGGMMSDAQVADVINYARTHFGNAYADAVSASDVAAARKR